MWVPGLGAARKCRSSTARRERSHEQRMVREVLGIVHEWDAVAKEFNGNQGLMGRKG